MPGFREMCKTEIFGELLSTLDLDEVRFHAVVPLCFPANTSRAGPRVLGALNKIVYGP